MVTTPWPAAAAKQWACWGREKGCLFNPKFDFNLSPWHSFDKPLLSFGFTDDHMAPETAIDSLLQQIGQKVTKNITNTDNQPIDKRIIDPKSIGLKHIGYFGFFKPETKTLWQNTATWIHQLTQH